MSHPEGTTYLKPEVDLVLSEGSLERGQKFIDYLVTAKKSMRELGIRTINVDRYTFNDGHIMVVTPTMPIYRKLIGYKYHKGPVVSHEDTISEPFSVSSFRVDGLYSLNDDTLTIEGSSPMWDSENNYLAHWWGEEYTFDPREHQIAIIDMTETPADSLT